MKMFAQNNNGNDLTIRDQKLMIIKQSRPENQHKTRTRIMKLPEKMESYNPPKVWRAEPNLGGKWGSVNKPTAGHRFDRDLPIGTHDLQLYSLATPNGIKVSIFLEELLEMGIKEAEYDAWIIEIGKQDQFGSGFVSLNPNSKIPAMVDYNVQDGSEAKEPLTIFESGSILMYLADKFGAKHKHNLFPSSSSIRQRAEATNWLMWQMGSAPFVGGGFGHFYHYAPKKIEYAINRYTMETKRQLDVLEKHLSSTGRTYMLGDSYSLVDIAVWAFHGQLALGNLYGAHEFLDVTNSYPTVIEWAKRIAKRPAVQRGLMVNKPWGPEETQLLERHGPSDFLLNTEAAKKGQKRKNPDKAPTEDKKQVATRRKSTRIR